ncbi:bark storage protein A [Mercurialis annua]|uniref:bark storage protein A n=1 Tax=Mercurialis annua TaxID=3986 RepID=UPI002160D5EF|nr:bark storage protein A [Mercurialis annua]
MVNMENLKVGFLVLFVGIGIGSYLGYAEISEDAMKKIDLVNEKGQCLGIVVPNAFEMNPLLQSPKFVADDHLPYLDFSGRRFRTGKLENVNVIIVMTGLSMLNAGVTTQLLLSLFKINGVVHYGIAGNANPSLQIGDVTIPQFWAHTGLWNWQRYGDGPDDELSLESNGDYTRKLGFLDFSDYNNKTGNQSDDNLLNKVWFQPEEIFPVNGVPEVRQRAFWVPVDPRYFKIAGELQNLKLEGCVNSTCLPRTPIVTRVKQGVSANVFVDNRAYREFLNDKFNATPIDMESAAVALICHQQRMPFIVIRALSDLAGGGSAVSNEAGVFASLAAQNAVVALAKFVSLLFG